MSCMPRGFPMFPRWKPASRPTNLAYRMQSSAPEAVDLSRETAETIELYGLNDKTDRELRQRSACWHVGWSNGESASFNSSAELAADGMLIRQSSRITPSFAAASIKPIAALLSDLRRRGLLDQTLVVWGGEFGRTPMSEKGDGRDHNPTGFTMWMAGGGVRGGQVIGATDELGLYAVEDRAHVHDIHASILHLMGLDRLKLSYNYQGRLERPTVNEGKMIEKLVV